ncbi:hypothetical protein B0H17DRAFT_1333384 [Mycena rosella]|uniref:F-box domain-containing protein n=1 Tax=Mycena rosella TaxID=1033263 RepID=A0AAD7D7B6_MYCRO|nr:hypothetical protein B0H17DRAFT_1333384 [Mycena rosella]
MISYSPVFAAAVQIETLEIDISLLSTISLPAFLRGLPHTLRVLKIVPASSPIFHPIPRLPHSLVPGIEALAIDSFCPISDKALLRFIQSRTLKRVAMHFAREMQLDVRAELQPRMQESGFHLELIYAPPPVLQSSPWDGLSDAWDVVQDA